MIQKHNKTLHNTLYYSITILAITVVALFFSTDYEFFSITINKKMGNIGVCSVLLAIATCMMLYMRHSVKSSLLKTIIFLFIILCIYVINQCKCRTAFIVVAVYCFSGFFYRSYDRKYDIERKKYATFFRLIAFLFITIRIISISSNLTKANSFSGRCFILGNCFDMFIDKPLTGHGGLGSFAATYPLYQAKWFSMHHSMDETFLIADNVRYAGNDYVQALCETGLFGAIVLGGLIIYVLLSLKRDTFLSRSLVLPLLFAAATYYILHTTLFYAITLVLCTFASYRCRKIIVRSKGKTTVFAIITICCVFVTYYDIHHYYIAHKIHFAIEAGQITNNQAVAVIKRYGENHKLIALLPTAYTDSTDEIYHEAERHFSHSDMLWAEGHKLLMGGYDSLGE